MDIQTAEKIRTILNERDMYLNRLNSLREVNHLTVAYHLNEGGLHVDQTKWDKNSVEFSILENGYLKIVRELESQIHEMFSK